MNSELFFCLKKSIYVKSNSLALSEICEIYGTDDTAKLSKYTIAFDNIAKTVTAFDVSKELSMMYPDFTITNIGPLECDILLHNNPQSKKILILKTLVLCIIMFFGGAITIMTFHEDTNMRSVHTSIYQFFNGEEKEDVPIVSIPYSFGIAVGFALLYGLFKKKKNQPSILDLNIFEHRNTLKKYLSENNKQDDG